MEGAAAQAEQQHRHSHKSYSIAAGAHIQQQQHRAMDAKASRRKRGGRTGEGEKEEHTLGEQTMSAAMAATAAHARCTAAPGQAKPYHGKRRSAQHGLTRPWSTPGQAWNTAGVQQRWRPKP